MRSLIAAGLAGLFVASCDGGQGDPQTPVQNISVRSAEQEQLHGLNDLNRAIALKRAIHDSGYRCQRVTRTGYVGTYKNLEYWTASCDESRNWAVFVGPDGSVQVRDCKDVAEFGLPRCEIKSAEGGAGELPAAE